MHEREERAEDRAHHVREHLPGDEDTQDREGRARRERPEPQRRSLWQHAPDRGGAVERRDREHVEHEEQQVLHQQNRRERAQRREPARTVRGVDEVGEGDVFG